MRAVRGILFAAGAVAACAGCFLVTGSTNGYAIPVEAGPDAQVDRAPGPLTTDSGFAINCISAAECRGDGGAEICCLEPTSTTAATTNCRRTQCTATLSAQLCATDAECGDASACIAQRCEFDGTTVVLRACGRYIVCEAL